MHYFIISEKDIPQVKPLMPMATDYRLGHKTADWIMGFNSCRQEFMSKARVIDEEGLRDCMRVVQREKCNEGKSPLIADYVDAICKFIEKGVDMKYRIKTLDGKYSPRNGDIIELEPIDDQPIDPCNPYSPHKSYNQPKKDQSKYLCSQCEKEVSPFDDDHYQVCQPKKDQLVGGLAEVVYTFHDEEHIQKRSIHCIAEGLAPLLAKHIRENVETYFEIETKWINQGGTIQKIIPK